jgi:hypothetical protein
MMPFFVQSPEVVQCSSSRACSLGVAQVKVRKQGTSSAGQFNRPGPPDIPGEPGHSGQR